MDDAPFSFTDKRKFREGADGSEPQPAAAGDGSEADGLDPVSAEASALYESAVQDADALKERVSELEEQLKRDQAEYVNSRRRIEQSAQQAQQRATDKVLASLLSVLDDVDLARQHGDLADGTPFGAIAAKLEEAVGAHGLVRFGQVGDDFDPAIHEALMHQESADADSTTLQVIMQPGYMIGERVVRPARVGTLGPS